MNPITNSDIKEQMRQRNEAFARNKEAQIRSQLAVDIGNLRYKPNYKFTMFGVGGAVLGLLLVSAFGIVGIPIGVGIGAAVWFGMNQTVKTFNANIDKEKQRLQDDANRRIREEYNQSDRRTQQEMDAYDREVKQYASRILGKAETVGPMVDHVTNMFQRMISHADSGAHMRFVEASFTYQVMNTGIQYSYQSQYTNPQDNYNFNKERYRDLSRPEECEGLAQALAKLTIKKMTKLYPPNSINITVAHNDARVTLHFKGANKNFVPARDII